MAHKVVTRNKDWKAIVQNIDKDHNKNDEVVYRFSKSSDPNAGQFKNTDHTDSGIYEK